ncbi:MAG: creatininase family protein [Planctomycetota bacterium]
MFPDNTRRRWAQTLGDEFKSGDCHAGQYETSIVLEADGAAVRADKARALPAVQIDLVSKIQGGARNFLQCGAVDAYCGNPAAATAEEGGELIQRLGEMLATSVFETWPDLCQ